MAEQGSTLEAITAAGERVAASVGTMGVSLTACSVPGCLPSFSLAADEMELGLGWYTGSIAVTVTVYVHLHW